MREPQLRGAAVGSTVELPVGSVVAPVGAIHRLPQVVRSARDGFIRGLLGLETGPGQVTVQQRRGDLLRDQGAHGARATDNSFQMDGIQVNNFHTNRSTGVPVPAPDAIEEFKVQTGQFDAGSARAGRCRYRYDSNNSGGCSPLDYCVQVILELLVVQMGVGIKELG